MKFKLINGAVLASAAVLAFSFGSQAFAGNVEYDYATVIDAEPIFKSIRVKTPRKHCWEEEVAYETDYYGDKNYHYANQGANQHNGTSTVLGGVIGAAIGNAVGHRKKNKQVGTVIGAVLGASIGNAYGSQKNRRQNHGQNQVQYVTYGTEERCEVIQETHQEERIVGYKVRYRYSNATYSTRTKVDPGDTIRVRISISPVV
jgi:uncharacterized protein YcfJ